MTSIKGLVLAAGLGTRLRPLTFHYAKPSLPIIGIPAVWFPIWHFSRAIQIQDIAINLSYLPETVRKALEDPILIKSLPVSFHFSDESQQILGSSGALRKIKNWVGKSMLFVSNGDTICCPNWKQMLDFHQQNKSKITLHVRSFQSSTEQYRHLEVAQDGRLLALREKRHAGFMFTGNYIIESDCLERLPEGKSELVPSLLEPLLLEEKAFTFVEDAPWFDTGNVTDFFKAQFLLLKQLPQLRELIELKMTEISPHCWQPRDWDEKSFLLDAPCILSGSQDSWSEFAMQYELKSFGPFFYGFNPSRTCSSLPVPLKNGILVNDVFCGLPEIARALSNSSQ